MAEPPPSPRSLDDDQFQRVTEAARKAVRDLVLGMLKDSRLPDVHQAVVLGGFAGAAEAFACACAEGVTRDRMREAARNCADDFAGQAFDELHPEIPA